MGFVLTILLAMMAQWGIGNYGGRGSGGIASLFRTGEEPASRSGKPDTTTPLMRVLVETMRGVILWPEIKSVTTLVAPLAGEDEVLSQSEPMNIPFGGEYWLYRWPYRRPPQHSRTRRGTPAALSFRTTDRVPLKMEAYQKLEQPMSLRCCRQLRLVVLNVDRYPKSVSLEVLLIDKRAADGAQQSLGLAPVISVPDRGSERPGASSRDLGFPDPSRIAFERIR